MGISVWIEHKGEGKRKRHIVRAAVDGRKLPSRGKTYFNPDHADRELVRWRDELEGRRAGAAPLLASNRISELAELYKAAKPRKDPATVGNDAIALRRLRERFGDAPLDAVTVEGLEAWRDDLLKTRKVGGVRWLFRVCRAAFNWAKKRRRPPLIHENPFDYVDLPAQTKRPPPPADADIEKLWDAFPKSAEAPAKFLLLTGLRRSELVRADHRDLSRLRVKAAGGRTVVIGALKVLGKNGDERFAPVHPDALALLGPKRAEGPLFPGIKRDWLSHAMALARKKSGVAGVTVHALRHKWATAWRSRVPWGVVKSWGGWKTDAAAGVYQHPEIEEMKLILRSISHPKPTFDVSQKKPNRGKVLS